MKRENLEPERNNVATRCFVVHARRQEEPTRSPFPPPPSLFSLRVTRVYLRTCTFILLAALTLDGAEARAEGRRGARAQVGRVAPLLQARGRLHCDLVDEICRHAHTHTHTTGVRPPGCSDDNNSTQIVSPCSISHSYTRELPGRFCFVFLFCWGTGFIAGQNSAVTRFVLRNYIIHFQGRAEFCL